jgi:hypothetical protein
MDTYHPRKVALNSDDLDRYSYGAKVLDCHKTYLTSIDMRVNILRRPADINIRTTSNSFCEKLQLGECTPACQTRFE